MGDLITWDPRAGVSNFYNDIGSVFERANFHGIAWPGKF
jgi:hypothetical protein